MKSSFHRLIPFLVISLQLTIPKTRLNSLPQLPSSYLGRLASWNSTFHSRLLFYTAEHFARTTHKNSLYFSSGVFTNPLPSNRYPIVARVDSSKNVFTESLPSNGYTRHNMILNGYFSIIWNSVKFIQYLFQNPVALVNDLILRGFWPITVNENHTKPRHTALQYPHIQQNCSKPQQDSVFIDTIHTTLQENSEYYQHKI
jgi:hypothetical protein